MKRVLNFFSFSCLWILVLFVVDCFGQVTVSGTIKDPNSQSLPGVNVQVVGKIIGTNTGVDGNFSFKTSTDLPFKISITGIGFKKQELSVTKDNQNINIVLEEQIAELNAVVVTASRIEEGLLQSPVTVEKMDALSVKEVASASFYDGLANLKGVDVVSSSMLMKAVNTRGFGGPFQQRFVQRSDGMDMQSPSFSIPFGNIAGIHDIDVESVEIQAGPASALYGANAFNGIMNITSKNPFLHEGLTVQVKNAINNVNNESVDASAYFETALRYAKSFKNKFAFKLNFSYLNGEDWVGDDQRVVGVDGKVLDENAGVNGDALNTYGDNPGISPIGGETIYRTGYREIDLVDYGVENMRADASLHYRITDNMEVSYLTKYAEGKGLITGGNKFRYSPVYWINKLELKGSNFFLRAYNMDQKAGDDSYDVSTGAIILNAQQKSDYQWFMDYEANFNQTNNHTLARAAADQGRLLPDTDAFDAAWDRIKREKNSSGGSAFVEEGRISHVEGQYDFKQFLPDPIEVLVGGSYRRFQVKSQGTLFDDLDEPASYYDIGSYLQTTIKLLKDQLKITGSLRYDKSQYFDGLVSPRIATVFTAAKKHNFRASYQTGFKNPTFQEQSIHFVVAPGTPPVLVTGGRPDLFEGNPIHTQGTDVNGNPITVPLVEPEKVTSFEVGYRSFINSNVFVDVSYNRDDYEKFIGVDVTKLVVYTPELATGTPGTAPDGVYIVFQNLSNTFTSQSISGGTTVLLGKGFNLGANYTFIDLIDEQPETFTPSFNTPEHKINVTFGNRKLTEKLGFNIAWKWQSKVKYIFAFGPKPLIGEIDPFSVVDAQLTYQIKKGLSAKIGGANLFNQYYRQALNTGLVGGFYYITLTFDQFGK